MGYKTLPFIIVISFVIMYAVMFLNVDEGSHIYLSTTRFYMSVLMVTPMAVMMPLMMPAMYPNRKLNTLIIATGVLCFFAALIFLRNQSFISDEEYMKAMIPHHSSAIMTSKHATISDPEVKALSEQIIKSQQEEIAQMKAILKRLPK